MAFLLPEVSPLKSGADDLSDPLRYMPPEEELRATQKQHQKLQFAIEKEINFTAKMSEILEKELLLQKCPLKRKPALSSGCAHIVS